MKRACAQALCLLLIAATLLTLGGCGEKTRAGTGKYLCVSIDYGLGDDPITDTDGRYLELRNDGTATFYYGDSLEIRMDGKWKVDGTDFTFTNLGQDDKGTLKGNTVTLDYAGTIYTFVLEGTEAPSSAPASSESSADGALRDWWSGDWYGLWYMTSGTGDYQTDDTVFWDCCAHIDLDEDNVGTFELWDADLPRGDGVCSVSVSLKPDGLGEHGALYSESGWFMDSDLGHADWIIDPALSGYDHALAISGDVEDESGSYHYEILLRKWGERWDDAGSAIPEGYESWYLPLIEAGAEMPDAIDSTDAPASPDPDDFGKSNAEATGVTTLDALRAAYQAVHAESQMTYESVAAILGVDGIPWKKDSVSWSDTIHYYQWFTADGSDFYYIGFQVNEDGSETFNGGTWSDAVAE